MHTSLVASPASLLYPHLEEFMGSWADFALCPPESTNYRATSKWSWALQSSQLCQKHNHSSLWLLGQVSTYGAAKQWHISRVPGRLICASPSPLGTALTPLTISRYIQCAHNYNCTIMHRSHITPACVRMCSLSPWWNWIALLKCILILNAHTRAIREENQNTERLKLINN